MALVPRYPFSQPYWIDFCLSNLYTPLIFLLHLASRSFLFLVKLLYTALKTNTILFFFLCFLQSPSVHLIDLSTGITQGLLHSSLYLFCPLEI